MNRLVVFLAALIAAAAPATAQLGNGTEGDMFVKALKDGDRGTAYEMMQTKASSIVNHRGSDGEAAIHIITRARDSIWLGYLLANGADPNAASKDGDTPLILAARVGYSEGVSRLLMKRALVDKVNKRGESPLIVAVNQRQPGIVKLLLEAGADPDRRDYAAGYSARDYAKRDSRLPEMHRLIETVKSKKTEVAGPTRS